MAHVTGWKTGIRMSGAFGRECVLVDRREEFDVRGKRHEVVPLVAERDARSGTADRVGRRVARNDLHLRGLESAVVIIVRVAEKSFIPWPVVLRAVCVVHSDEAAARPHVLPQVYLGAIKVCGGRRRNRECRINSAPMIEQGVATVAEITAMYWPRFDRFVTVSV
jgi:hypothetical protein